MKKIAASFVTILVIFLSAVGVCHAGDVPEALLYTDTAQLYFGEMIEWSDTSATILPVKNIKGDVVLNKEITYSQGLNCGKPQKGKVYLIGWIDEHNLYYWGTNGTDTKTLKLDYSGGMNQRLQEYLNNGDFEKAEEAREQKAASTAEPSPSPASAPAPSATEETLSPANTDSPLPVSAGFPEKPASGLNPVTIFLIAAVVVLAAAVIVLLAGRRKKTDK